MNKRNSFAQCSTFMEGDMNKAVQAVIGLGLLSFGFTQAVASVDISKLKRVTQTLVAPPAVPKHDQVAKGGPKIVQVRMVTTEKQVEIAPGAKVWALTFNGSVPGPLIVVHEGDYVELTLVNPKESSLAHNVDFHAATGALGGAGLTLVQPGEEVVLRFKAIKPGVFVYHCAPGGTMIPFHVISGMSGAIMVLPRDGLKDAKGKSYTYDKAYYIGESDWYLPKDDKGAYKSYASPAAGMADMLEVAKGLVPTHVVFNGAVGSITGRMPCLLKLARRFCLSTHKLTVLLTHI
jgi:nitrite reductase (NO-forming)